MVEVIVCVLAKPPVPGEVKTRLTGVVGQEGAAVLASAFLRDTWSAFSTVDWARAVVSTTGPLGDDFDDVESWDQGDGDLGQRLERTLVRGLGEAPLVFAVGSDSPGLPLALIEQARDALASADAVLGPCADGGFYLLGLKRCPPDLLADLPWSQADTLERVRERLKARGLSVAVLPPWFDVDRPEDLARLEHLIRDGCIDAPATARALAGLKRTPGPPVGEPRISVVIPTLDEAARIAARLRELAAMPAIAEVVVVDGGSCDDTVAIARSFPGVRVLGAPRGRASQMNRGAAVATGDVLIFLHADVALPVDAERWVRVALADERVVAGAFRTWTVPDTARSWLAPLLHLADLRSRYTSLPYGDQALFVRSGAFRAAGGFPEIPIMEDLQIARRLQRLGRIRTVPASVRVSGRRFLARPIYYTLLVNVLPLLYRLGVPPTVLARPYWNPR